jgi:hypothetical protein
MISPGNTPPDELLPAVNESASEEVMHPVVVPVGGDGVAVVGDGASGVVAEGMVVVDVVRGAVVAVERGGDADFFGLELQPAATRAETESTRTALIVLDRNCIVIASGDGHTERSDAARVVYPKPEEGKRRTVVVPFG